MNKEVIDIVLKFRNDRDWEQFHSGENLAKALIIEAAELLEHFQWSDKEDSVEGIKEELADVFIYGILIAEKYNLNIEKIVKEKIVVNDKKYPIEKAKGKSDKYTNL